MCLVKWQIDFIPNGWHTWHPHHCQNNRCWNSTTVWEVEVAKVHLTPLLSRVKAFTVESRSRDCKGYEQLYQRGPWVCQWWCINLATSSLTNPSRLWRWKLAKAFSRIWYYSPSRQVEYNGAQHNALLQPRRSYDPLGRAISTQETLNTNEVARVQAIGTGNKGKQVDDDWVIP